MRVWITAVLLLILLPSVIAIEDVRLTFNGHAIHTISSDRTINANFEFEVTTEDTNAFIFITVLNRDNYNLPLQDCDYNGTYSCTLPVIFEAAETVNYTIKYVGSETIEVSDSLSFILDDSTPVLSEIKTSYCDSDCYVSSLLAGNDVAQTTVIATFEDDVTSFDYKLVKFKVGSEEKHATSCEGNSCTAVLTSVPCQEGSQVPISVVQFAQNIPSSEDALNAVDNGLEITAICDATAPVIESLVLESSGIPGIYYTGQNIIVKATVLDDTGVSFFIDTTNISDSGNITQDCVSQNGKYVCEATISNLIAGEKNLVVKFFDGVGNVISKEQIIVILEGAESEEKLDFLTTEVLDVTPDSLNRVALQLATDNGVNYPVLVDYVLHSSTNTIEVVTQVIDSLDCYFANKTEYLDNESLRNSNLFSPQRSFILNPKANIDSENRFVLNFDVSAEDLYATTYGRCYYDVYLKEDNILYTTPEVESFDFTLHLENAILGTPGQAFVDEIKNYEKKMDSTYGKTLSKITEVGATLDEVCAIYDTINYGMQLGVTMQTVGTALIHGGLTSGIGAIILGAGNAIKVPFGLLSGALVDSDTDAAHIDGKVAELADQTDAYSKETLKRMYKFSQDSSAFGWLREACDVYNCASADKSLDLIESDNDWCNDLNKDWQSSSFASQKLPNSDETVGGMVGNLCVPNYEQSIIASLGLTGGGVCVKGVFYNLQKWQANDCGYLTCLKEQSLQGASIDLCKDAKQFKECTTIYGEIFELPFLNVVARASALINGAIQNAPAILLKLGGNIYCNGAKTVAIAAGKSMIRQLIEDTVGIPLNLIKKIGKMMGLFKAANTTPIDTVKRPIIPGPQMSASLGCHILDAIWRVNDFQALKAGGGGAQLHFEDNNDLCKAALCTAEELANDDCDYGDSYLGWVKDVKALRREANSFRDDYNRLYRDYDKVLNEETCKGMSRNKCEREYNDLLTAYEQKRQQAYEELKKVAATYIAKWLKDKGYLDSLKLSDWGSWGESVARTAAENLDPNQWKSNICSGILDLDADETQLFALSDGVGPVLTFAAEIREITINDSTEYIYTVAYFIRTDSNETYKTQFYFKEPKLWINETDQLTETLSTINLTSGDELSRELSFTNPNKYDEFCIEFNEYFPDWQGSKTFCREITDNAFNRGQQGDLFE